VLMVGTAYLMGGVVQDDPSQEQLYSRDTYSLSFNTLTISQATNQLFSTIVSPDRS